ncbi:MAG: GNAT family N-acetyltransferase [Burkholderiales bacterium]
MTAAAGDAPFTARRGAYEVAADPARLDLDVIHGFLAASYWSPGIPRDTVARALAGSLCFGLFRDDAQVGLARFVTDRATFAYLADVFVLEAHRRQGLATWMVGVALTHPALTGLRRFLLATRDQQRLYAKVGFAPLAHPERLMEIHRPDVYRTAAGG